MRAAGCGERDLAEALQALFGGRIGGLGGRGTRTIHEQVHRLHHKKEDRRGREQESGERVQKVAVQKNAAVDRERQLGEIRYFDDGTDERRQDIFHQRLHHRAEGRSHHDADRQIDDIAPEQKLFEFREHGHGGSVNVYQPRWLSWCSFISTPFSVIFFVRGFILSTPTVFLI